MYGEVQCLCASCQFANVLRRQRDELERRLVAAERALSVALERERVLRELVHLHETRNDGLDTSEETSARLEAIEKCEGLLAAAERRVDERGLVLPGWTCPRPACRAFNGEAKERRETCRACEAARP
jgi:hypothetical protein